MTLKRALLPQQIEMAAQYLMGLRVNRQPGERMPESFRPITVENGWQIQRRFAELKAAKTGGSIKAWKCGLPVLDKWVVAPIYSDSVSFSSPTESIAVASSALRVELEFAFVLGKNLPARDLPYMPAEVDAAIGGTRFALELIGGRYARPDEATFPEWLADGLFNDGLILGPIVENLPEVPQFTLVVHAQNVDSIPIQTSYVACHSDSNPRLALYWLVEHLRKEGLGLQAGQAVITGALSGVIELPAPARIRMNFERFGEWTTTLLRTEQAAPRES